MALTDNMKLDLPVPSTTPGPTYASEIVTAFGDVDEHNHTTDHGVKVPSAGLNVNDDVPCNDHNLTDARTVRFHNQAAALALATDLGCLYEAGGDLYWNSGAGDQVRLTSGPALDAASIGAIGGDYGTSTASLYYTTASKTFTFESDTLKAAAIDAGPLTIREIATSAKGITIESPDSLAADYGLTLPAELPASTRILTLSAAGVVDVIDAPVPVRPSVPAGWTNGAGDAAVGYWKDLLGRVHMLGMAAYISGSTSPFTLPVGCRPKAQRNYLAIATNVGASAQIVTISAAGVVNIPFAETGKEYVFDNISMLAEQ
jgi:hypothetical protein